MSILQKIIGTVAQFIPDKEPDPLIHKHGYVGKPFSRVDGQLKVKGEAHFAAEFKIDNLVYAALVHSTIAKGKAAKIDASEARRVAGFITIITPENMPKTNAPTLVDVTDINKGFAASNLPVLQDDRVHWDGQPVAVVLAETLDQAEYAASLVRVEYEAETPAVSFEALKAEAAVPSDILGEPPEVEIGNAGKALTDAEVSVDQCLPNAAL